MADLTPAAHRWLADHHGVITLAALSRCGVGRSTALTQIAKGALVIVAKGVYILPCSPATIERRCVVLCAAHPAGFVTGPTAGTLAGLRRMPRQAPLHFSIRHGRHLPVVPGVHFRQTTALSQLDRRARADGIVVASWPRLAFDLAADLRALDHLSVVQQLRHEHHVTTEQLIAIGDRLAHPARPGSKRFLETLERLGGRAPNESHPEVRLAEALRSAGIPVEHQTQLLPTPDGQNVRIDLAVPRIRWGIELDIHPEHLTLDRGTNDSRRLRRLHRIDWQIETVREPDLEDLDALVRELAGLYHARCRVVGRSAAAS